MRLEHVQNRFHILQLVNSSAYELFNELHRELRHKSNVVDLTLLPLLAKRHGPLLTRRIIPYSAMRMVFIEEMFYHDNIQRALLVRAGHLVLA